MSKDKEIEKIYGEYPPVWGRDLGFFSRRKSHEPWYDDTADYNTNAKSYYDYLARLNGYLHAMTDFINRLAARDLNTKDTNSISFKKDNDWQGDKDYDDMVSLSANVKISSSSESKSMNNLNPSSFTINNGTTIKTNGVWSPDYMPILTGLNKEIGNLQNDISNMKKDISYLKDENKVLRGALQKIINNLNSSDAITNNNINTYAFRSGRNIATGNINLFGGTPDGNSFIRTNSGKSNNDITAGY